MSERADAEQALRESEARYRATFDHAAVGIAHVAPGGTFVHVNERVCAILGYSREELVGRTFPEVFHPDDLAVWVSGAERILGGTAAPARSRTGSSTATATRS